MTKEVDKIDLLEEKVTQLVEAYGSLRNEKTSLGEKLAEREMEIQGLNERIARLSQERETARQKVDGLLVRIDRLISGPGRDEKK
jgi:chromosome segregation ATPase